ncbi:MAG: hypothetical protein U9N54_03900 [candidate division Zixibacteria bacterium]|nr:hypothetical protein [candidate division Zixibacteria bacterium]
MNFGIDPKSTLLIGYAFSLKEDGAPGDANVAIAKRMWSGMENDNPALRPHVAVQWEIFDALQDLDCPAVDYIPDNHVVQPPAFTEEDFLGRGAIVQSIATPFTPAEYALHRVVQKSPYWSSITKHLQNDELFKISKADLTLLFNSLLADGQERLYLEFVGLLDLHDFHRGDKGAVGLEKRSLPNDGPRGKNALRKFQSKRINRLILEEVLAHSLIRSYGGYQTKTEMVRRGSYLNVDGVASTCLHEIAKSGHQIKRIFVYGHPEHCEWCRNRTSAKTKEILGLSDEKICLGDNSSWSDTEMWDTQSAQIWCRSEGNWRYYAAL